MGFRLGGSPKHPSILNTKAIIQPMKNLIILTAALFISLGVSADEGKDPASEPQGELFVDTMDVNLVNVEVFVTGKKGERIRGLTVDDFELFEDGRPLKISNFYVVEDGKPLVPQSSAEVESGQGPSETAKPAPDGPPGFVVVPDSQRLNLVVYVDNYNIRPFNRNRVFRSIRKFLQDNLTPGDQVMLVSYDRSLHVRREFTSDTRRISTALYELEETSGHGVHQDSDRRDIMEAITEAESVGEVYGRARTLVENQFNDLAFTITHLHDFVTSLAGLRGRKAILYVSDGVPMRAGDEIFARLQDKFGNQVSMIEAFEFDASRRWQSLAAQANANRVTMYTLDAAGLRAPSSSSVEEMSPGGSLFVDQIRIANIQAPLLLLAEETGGIAIINSNDPTDSLVKIAQDFSTYYSLGYLPAHSGDGRYHRIKIKVKGRKGIKVRHRDGYRDKSPSARMTDGTLSSLRWGVETNPLGIDIGIGRQERRSDGYFNVEVLVKIPLNQIVLVPREEQHEARLKLYFSAADIDDRISPVQEVLVPILIPNEDMEQALGQLYLYRANLMMEKGEHRIAAGVRDELGHVSAFLRRSVVVGR